MRNLYIFNNGVETQKNHFHSGSFSRTLLPKFVGLGIKQSIPQALGKQAKRIGFVFFLLAFNQLCQAQTTPADGVYSFRSATSNGNGTYTTSDGFFLILGNNGSSNMAAPDQVMADQYGAFMNDVATTTSGTSYLEVKVKNGGSFQIVSSVIGDYNSGTGVHDFYNVYAAGLVNGVVIATTPTHNSTGVYEADYNLNFSDFAGKSIDAFRVYYSWNSGTNQQNFNLQDMTIAGASSTPPSTLPLTWLSFTAKKQDRAVQLSWSTAVEQNTKDFIVQHSANGSNWSTIGTIAAAGNSSTVQNYSFLHQFPVRGANYYRLLQRDIDDRKSYSKVVTIDMDGSEQVLRVYPNPVVDGTLTIKLQNAATVQIYNSLGTLVIQKIISSGGQQLNVGHLPKGLYTVKAGDQTASFIVQ